MGLNRTGTTMLFRHPAVPRAGCVAALLVAAFSAPSAQAVPHPGSPLTIPRAAGPITIDGDLSDAGWKGIEGITTWYETRVGDNVEPPVRNAAYLAYDDKYLYAGFQFDDPDRSSIRAPLGDHDQLSGTTDYGGLIVDSRDDGKTAQMFLANPRGLQYDAISGDVSGEDSSPDFFWDARGKITATGWPLAVASRESDLGGSGCSRTSSTGKSCSMPAMAMPGEYLTTTDQLEPSGRQAFA